MIEKIAINHLSTALTVPVYMEIPENPPNTFVLVEKTGSSRTNRVNRATLAVQSWAGSLLAAAELNERVKAAMDELAGIDDVSAYRLNSDYNFTDTAQKRHRYQAVYDITFYEE